MASRHFLWSLIFLVATSTWLEWIFNTNNGIMQKVSLAFSSLFFWGAKLLFTKNEEKTGGCKNILVSVRVVNKKKSSKCSWQSDPNNQIECYPCCQSRKVCDLSFSVNSFRCLKANWNPFCGANQIQNNYVITVNFAFIIPFCLRSIN